MSTATLLDGPVPKHVQLRELLARSAREQLAAHAPVGSERELMRRHGVSRATVREAIGQLVSDGVLYRVRGKGTFVASARVESTLHLASFTEDMRRRGLEPVTRVLDVALAVPPQPEAHALGLEPGGRAWRMERLRIAGGQPMAVELGWFPELLVPRLDTHDLTQSIYTLLAEAYGLTVDRGEQTVWAEPADPRRADLLEVPAGSSLLAFHRASSARHLRVEATTSWYRGDRYQVHMTLERDRPPGRPAT